jgi:glucokinase
MLLAGDIGGTKTDLAIYAPDRGPVKPVAQAEFHSADFPSLEEIARKFLATTNLPVVEGCFAIAGPVIDGCARTTNLPWVVEERHLARELGLRAARLLNDLEATAVAVPVLDATSFHALNDGTPVTGGTIAVIAPGTGLGEAFLTWEDFGYHAHASEGGHADFAPTDQTQVDLLRHMMERFDHVSYEHVCSGLAIPFLYDFLLERGAVAESPEFAARLAAAKDRTPLIVEEGAKLPSSPTVCTRTLQLFTQILGAEAGNLALKVLATGGVYLGGGLPPRMLAVLEQPGFMQAFQGKGRLGEMLARIPVNVILKPAALIGAAAHGLRLYANA